jgi:tetratricopeptide (TPR) repeat protein
MGRKRTRAREFIYFCIAGLILFSITGCAALEKMKMKIKSQGEAYQHLRHSKELLAQGDYEGASNANLKILSLAIHRSPEDRALFNMGLIYTHPKNPKKDYEKSLFFFKKLMMDYPQSPWAERAKIWTGILQEIEELNQTIGTLNQTIEAFNQMNERLKKVDTKAEDTAEARESLLRGQKLLAQGNYEGALRENQKSLSLSGQNPPGDEALFNMGLIYAHPGNSKKEYGKSLFFFKRLMKDYPQSSWVEPAKAWTRMLQEIEKLNQTVQQLNQVIEKSKQVDIEIEEKKREKTK